MKKLKTLAWVAAPLFLASLLWSQDLTEAAKKEKARREAMKGKKVTVVSNADLSEVKKKPAVAVESQEPEAEAEEGQAQPAEPQAGEETAAADETAEGAETAAPVEPSTEALPMSGGGMSEAAPAAPAADPQRNMLETNWMRAKEYADLLELKLNSLWQDFYNMDDMMSKDRVQELIAETFDKLQIARNDEAKAKDELDKYLGVVIK